MVRYVTVFAPATVAIPGVTEVHLDELELVTRF